MNNLAQDGFVPSYFRGRFLYLLHKEREGGGKGKGRKGGRRSQERGSPPPPPPPGPFLTYSNKLHKFDLVEIKKAQFW